jgi:DNA end-binding protein Ku
MDEFVDRSEIDPRYLIRPYHLVPDGKVGHDAFAVVRETIRAMNKVAVGREQFVEAVDGVSVDHPLQHVA